MQICESIASMRTARDRVRTAGRTIGFVPTMGALHAGHLSLVRAAREACGSVAVSIFVNPTQFGPGEDFTRYPRTFAEDCALLEAEGVELLFAPSPAEMYPAGAATRVHVGPLSDRLDGASRPGHFEGVATVVAKLFHIVEPDQAFFGQKDAAQVAVLRAMVRDLGFNLELVVCPIVREADGLAMSSRNRYLLPADREQALVLSQALAAAKAFAATGQQSAAAILQHAGQVLATRHEVRLDYLSLVDPDTLEPVDTMENRGSKPALLALAAYVGSTRLIDNVLL